jgi:hypothetical protein
MFEDLNYDELKRRANSSLPDAVVATPRFAPCSATKTRRTRFISPFILHVGTAYEILSATRVRLF